MKATNTPMPPAMAALSEGGTALRISSRTRSTVSSRNSTPDQKTIPSAVRQGTPMRATTLMAKKKFSPISGAWAIG